MQFDGVFKVHSPRERVFSFFMNARELARCVDDPHSLDVVKKDVFKGWVKSGVGFVKGTFKGSAIIVERKPPERARIKAHGRGMGSAVDIDSVIKLSEFDGETTVLWRADAVLSGKIANVGARVIRGTVEKKANRFFEKARKRLESG